MNLKRKNIVITGGTTGIGLELVRQLHADNHVAVIASNRARLQNLSREFSGVVAIEADLGRQADLEAAAGQVREHFDRVDLLINNAAVQNTPTFLDDDFEYASIGREIAVNLTAVCSLTALLLPAMIHDREAAIVNVNSGLALMPKTNSAVYCATKAAVNIFSQSLRYQLEGSNVKVLQVFMPLVATRMTDGRGDGKLTAAEAAEAMLRGVEGDIEEHDIGRIRVLRSLMRFAPGIARRIMKAA